MANSSTIPLPALQYLRSRTHPPASSLYLFFQHPYLLVQFGNSFIGDGQQLYSILPWSITEETVLSTYTVTKHSSLSLRRCYMGRFLNNKALQHFCDIVSYGCNIVPTLLPKKSLLQIISCNITVTKTDQSNDYIPTAITISYQAKTINLVNSHVWRRLGVIAVPEETIIF